MLTAHLFGLLPLWNYASRINLLSLACALASVGLAFLVIRKLAVHALEPGPDAGLGRMLACAGGLCGAWFLAFSSSFWSVAAETETYAGACAFTLLALANTADAISLVVMATNTTAILGDSVYTVGVHVTAADVAAGGANPVLFVQNVTFTGGAAGPVHSTGSGNKPDVQSVQSGPIDSSAINNGGPPSANLGSAGNNAFYKDSWWYNTAGGTLQGVIDSAGDPGTVTTKPASDGSGVS